MIKRELQKHVIQIYSSIQTMNLIYNLNGNCNIEDWNKPADDTKKIQNLKFLFRKINFPEI